MTRVVTSIVLGCGLLTMAFQAPSAGSGAETPLWRTVPADTARLHGFEGSWSGRPQWSPRDPGWRARPGSGQQRSAGSGVPMTRLDTTESVGEPVADPNLWGANGNILDIARSGNTLYIAGSFRSVGENSGGFVPVDAETGEPIRSFPKVAGSVYAIVPDGAGGWYIGGEFTGVGGRPRSCLAQIRADGSVTDWNPSVTGSPGYIDPPQVSALAVNGDRVFVGGGFRQIGGQPHENLGCVDARTGAVLDWNLDTERDAWVYTLAAGDSSVYVGGYFFTIGGQPRRCLAAVDATTGAVRPWQADAIGSVWALLLRGDTLFVGGEFGGIAGSLRSLLAAIDTRTVQLLPFDAHASGIYLEYVPPPQVHALALVGDTLYAAGNFTQIGGQIRSAVAALNVATGNAVAWAPDTIGPRYAGFPPRLCTTLAVQGRIIYVGGLFETVGGVSHPFVTAISRATGAVSGWNPMPDLSVYALAVQGSTVCMGGIFSSVGEWRHRAGLAAIDLTTGAVKPWNPNPDGSICTAVAVKDDRVIVSGDFASIGGVPQPRLCFAALDTVNGEVLPWNPGANQVANAFLLEGDTLYVGGYFTEVGGQPRNYVAAISATTGQVTGWNPDASSWVLTMARSGTTIFLGGIFQRLGGQLRPCLAAVDAVTGKVRPWDPQVVPGVVDALLVNENKVYVGGGFEQIGGQPRNSIAALDVTTGEATSWYPQASGWGSPIRVRALDLIDSTLFVGGSFGTMGGQPRICLAAVDTATGLATDWDPGLDGLVWSLAAAGSTVYVGGGFTRAGGLPCSGLAAFFPAATPAPSPLPSRAAIPQVWPNPVRAEATVRFALPSSGPASLEVFDLQGRRMQTILRDQSLIAGAHEVTVHTDGWPMGLYICRLQTRGGVASRKLLVVR